MIRFENLTKRFVLHGQSKMIMQNVNLTIPSRTSVALLGRNGAGKSTLLRMIAGTMDATSGRILSTGSISWPVGFAGSFHPDLSGAQNTKFIARVYGVDTNALSDFVEDFAELGKHFRLPLRSYSSGMRSRLAFGVSMGIGFDTYLVDEVTSVGDAAFRSKATELFNARMAESGAIVVSHSMPQIRQMCDSALVLEHGKAHYFENLEEAIALHESNMQGPRMA
ncbi:ABC transporter ATP-binding protein [Dinoroseobacter sp. S124A]|uniref:ABC transporter ATP-binding protein n=1 Tax=Dinoroseobacter sp. S124A TaxID=3415128 RepID=UPI003C7C3D6B